MGDSDIGTQARTSRFSTSLMDMLERVEYRRVRLDEQFDPVYRLRYEAYRREDGIAVNAEQIARDHLAEIEQKISELQAMQTTLTTLVEACSGDQRPDCPILSGLSRPAGV